MAKERAAPNERVDAKGNELVNETCSQVLKFSMQQSVYSGISSFSNQDNRGAMMRHLDGSLTPQFTTSMKKKTLVKKNLYNLSGGTW